MDRARAIARALARDVATARKFWRVEKAQCFSDRRNPAVASRPDVEGRSPARDRGPDEPGSECRHGTSTVAPRARGGAVAPPASPLARGDGVHVRCHGRSVGRRRGGPPRAPCSPGGAPRGRRGGGPRVAMAADVLRARRPRCDGARGRLRGRGVGHAPRGHRTRHARTRRWRWRDDAGRCARGSTHAAGRRVPRLGDRTIGRTAQCAAAASRTRTCVARPWRSRDDARRGERADDGARQPRSPAARPRASRDGRRRRRRLASAGHGLDDRGNGMARAAPSAELAAAVRPGA